jgi:hypothetical protein
MTASMARKLPPFPRPSAVVDPRVGDYGPALLALEDGTLFPGIAFGARCSGQGDLVVNTSQTGYQEIATDPSYAGLSATTAASITTTSRNVPGCAV